jgi:hypothetical protein
MVVEETSEIGAKEILAIEKCTKLLAQNVEKNAKFHSNLQKANQFFAKSALGSEENSNYI